MMTITDVITFTTMTCPVTGCGVKYALDEEFRSRRRRDDGDWYCPNGHSLSYRHSNRTKTEELERKLAAAKGNAKYTQERLDRERRSHSATKGQLTKTKKRVAGGVCPCCNRSFVDLGRHMAGQHPDYVDQANE